MAKWEEQAILVGTVLEDNPKWMLDIGLKSIHYSFEQKFKNSHRLSHVLDELRPNYLRKKQTSKNKKKT
jgi:hypothetical protein